MAGSNRFETFQGCPKAAYHRQTKPCPVHPLPQIISERHLDGPERKTQDSGPAFPMIQQVSTPGSVFSIRLPPTTVRWPAETPRTCIKLQNLAGSDGRINRRTYGSESNRRYPRSRHIQGRREALAETPSHAELAAVLRSPLHAERQNAWRGSWESEFIARNELTKPNCSSPGSRECHGSDLAHLPRHPVDCIPAHHLGRDRHGRNLPVPTTPP
jgi:hypothetical protein